MPAKKTSTSIPQTWLDQYTSLTQQIASLQEQNVEIFAEAKRLEDMRKVAEENLKGAVRESGEALENDHFVVKPVASFRKWFDWDAVKDTAKKPELAIIEAEAVKSVEVDPAAMQRLVMEGKISPKIVQVAFREEQLTTRITIAVKK